jgi:putative NIF3 family GTP cyclohydrolase 1 type 2
MAKKMKNLTSEELPDTRNVVVALSNQERFIHLPLNKKDKYFSNPGDFIKFIKDIEKLIRTSKEYSNYIRYLKETVGLRNCVIFKDIGDNLAPIEMHHGPIFTLYDIVEIQIAYCYKNNIPINSPRIAFYVLKDHWNNIIQVVMLCKSAHLAVHNPQMNKDLKYFIPTDMSWGDINAFIEKYTDVLTIDHYNKIKRYLEKYAEYQKNADNPEKQLFFINNITSWADKIAEAV